MKQNIKEALKHTVRIAGISVPVWMLVTIASAAVIGAIGYFQVTSVGTMEAMPDPQFSCCTDGDLSFAKVAVPITSGITEGQGLIDAPGNYYINMYINSTNAPIGTTDTLSFKISKV